MYSDLNLCYGIKIPTDDMKAMEKVFSALKDKSLLNSSVFDDICEPEEYGTLFENHSKELDPDHFEDIVASLLGERDYPFTVVSSSYGESYYTPIVYVGEALSELGDAILFVDDIPPISEEDMEAFNAFLEEFFPQTQKGYMSFLTTQ